MAGTGGVEFSGPLRDGGGSLPPLRPGQVLQGTVEAGKDGPVLRVGDAVLSLVGEVLVNLKVGQRVAAEVLHAGPRLQVCLLPAQVGAASAAPAEASGSALEVTSPILLGILDSIGKVEIAPQAARLISPALLQTQAAVRLVLSLFLTPASTGEDLQILARLVGEAAARGVLPPQDAEAFVLLVRQWLPAVGPWQTTPDPESTDTRALTALVRHDAGAVDASPARVVECAADRAARPIEARLAEALASGRLEAALAEIDQELQAQIGRLRQSGSFVAFLHRTGQQGDFDQAAQRVLDRLSGGQLQNLRGQEARYAFFEVPFPPGAPIRNAQIHIVGEGRRRKRRSDPHNAVLAIDLATTRLGDLWISLTIHQGACRCHIRAETSEVVGAIDANASALAVRLAAAGYPGAQVSASLWNGDRLAEAGRLLTHVAGVDLRV